VFLSFISGFSVKVKLFVPLLQRLNLLLCVCTLPGKAVPEMTYTVLGGR